MVIRRVKPIVIVTIVFVVVLCIAAAISISLAQWISEANTSVTADGNSGGFYVDYPESSKTTKTVRQVKATTSGSGTTYTYSNYICVSRLDSSTDTDGSIAYLEFDVNPTDSTADDIKKYYTDVNIVSIEIARQEVNETSGIPTGEPRMSPRIYGLENVNKLSDIKHTNVPKEGDHTVDHVTGGIYVILYFSASDKYYAMDITITTDREAHFTLTATANNTNQWQRFEPGFGQPWGFYVGGLINGVDNWDPLYTTNMAGTVITGTKDSNMSAPKSIGLHSSDPDYDKKFQHPLYVDLSLTIKLTKDSQIKLYMVGEEGNRKEIGSITEQTVYFLPKNLDFYTFDNGVFNKQANVGAYYKSKGYILKDVNGNPVKADGSKANSAAEQVGSEYATYKTQNNQKVDVMACDFNLIIPETGEYTIRFYGAVTYKTASNERYDIANHQITTADNDTATKFFVQNKNCYVENAMLIFKGQNTGDNVKHVVSFVSAEGEGGGQIFGLAADHDSTLNNPPAGYEIGTTHNGYKIEGYYLDRECTKDFDFANYRIRQDTVIYVKWKSNIIAGYYLVGKFNNWTISSDYYLGTSGGSIKVTISKADLNDNDWPRFKVVNRASNGNDTYYGAKHLTSASFTYVSGDSSADDSSSSSDIKFNAIGTYSIQFTASNGQIAVTKDADITIQFKSGPAYIRVTSGNAVGVHYWKKNSTAYSNNAGHPVTINKNSLSSDNDWLQMIFASSDTTWSGIKQTSNLVAIYEPGVKTTFTNNDFNVEVENVTLSVVSGDIDTKYKAVFSVKFSSGYSYLLLDNYTCTWGPLDSTDPLSIRISNTGYKINLTGSTRYTNSGSNYLYMQFATSTSGGNPTNDLTLSWSKDTYGAGSYGSNNYDYNGNVMFYAYRVNCTLNWRY